jgi:hypothetical protein
MASMERMEPIMAFATFVSVPGCGAVDASRRCISTWDKMQPADREKAGKSVARLLAEAGDDGQPNQLRQQFLLFAKGDINPLTGNGVHIIVLDVYESKIIAVITTML